jgi:Conserved oligomeric complex COG6
MEALTQGETSARAIEIQAHDPLRYLGDILAWTHQAVAGEKEILTLIFGVAANSRQSELEPGNERWLEDGTILSALDDLIEKDLEGTCRPIRVYFCVSLMVVSYRTYHCFAGESYSLISSEHVTQILSSYTCSHVKRNRPTRWHHIKVLPPSALLTSVSRVIP